MGFAGLNPSYGWLRVAPWFPGPTSPSVRIDVEPRHLMRDPESRTHEAFRLIAERWSLLYQQLRLDVEAWRLMHETFGVMHEPPSLIDDAKCLNGEATILVIDAPEPRARGVEPHG